jgi:hypothetical protein
MDEICDSFDCILINFSCIMHVFCVDDVGLPEIFCTLVALLQHYCVSTMNTTIPAYVTSPYLLGFNEPNDVNQCNTSPHEAATLWGTLMQNFPDAKFVSPATAGTFCF